MRNLYFGSIAWQLTAVLLCSPAPVRAVAQGQPGRIALTIMDASNTRETGARVTVTDACGNFHVAEDAILVETRTRDLESAVGRLTLEKAQAGLTRRVKNIYRDTDFWYSTGSSSVELDPGVYRVTVIKGPEYRPETRDVVVEAGELSIVSISLHRWINMAAQGWYSADAHLHIARPTPQLNPSFIRWMQAEDLNIANCLEWGHSKYFHNAAQYAHGEEGRYEEGHFVIAAGQENPRTHFLGHTIILGADSPIDFRQQYLIYGLFWEEAERQGAVSGYAHKGTGAAGVGLSVDLPQKLIRFLEVLQLGTADYRAWYDILNTGFRMTPIAGTDYPFGISHVPGRERFYTRIAGPFSFEAWLEGVRAGRVFVTNGPMLEFQVDGQDPGGDIHLEQPGPIHIQAVVRFNPDLDDVRVLEAVENGKVIRSFSREPGIAEIRCDFSHEITEACWIAVRSSGKKIAETLPPPLWPFQKATQIVRAPSDAHSGAVYVSLKGQPTRDQHPRAKALAAQWLNRLTKLESQLTTDELDKLAKWPSFVDGVEIDVFLRDRRALLEAIQSAKQYFAAQAE